MGKENELLWSGFKAMEGGTVPPNLGMENGILMPCSAKVEYQKGKNLLYGTGHLCGDVRALSLSLLLSCSMAKLKDDPDD